MTETTFHGSCLCGAVKYEFEGAADKFYHCHCSRCRKATGTGHASNLFVKGGPVRWDAKEGASTTFKLPQAERFSTHFCTTCGSLLPRDIPKIGLVIVPAGTLDCDVALQPQARIFTGSKAAWSCYDAEAIPCFEEYPR